MRGKRAKALRKEVYGEDFSPREREYIVRDNALRNTGRRALYQQLKKIISAARKTSG